MGSWANMNGGWDQRCFLAGPQNMLMPYQPFYTGPGGKGKGKYGGKGMNMKGEYGTKGTSKGKGKNGKGRKRGKGKATK